MIFSFTNFVFYRFPRLLELEDRLVLLLDDLFPDVREAELFEVTCREEERFTELLFD
jgi:hypothetical protein